MLVMNYQGTALYEAKLLRVHSNLNDLNLKWYVYADPPGIQVSKNYNSQEEACEALMGFYDATHYGGGVLYFYDEENK